MRTLILLLSALALTSCSRDPNVVKMRYLESGNKYFDRGRYKEASIMYRNALAKDALFGQAHYKMALTEMRLGKLPQAVPYLRRAVECIPPSAPERWDAALKLADIFVSASRDQTLLAEAEAIVKDLLARDANSFDGHRLTGDLAYVNAQRELTAKNREAGEAALKSAIQSYRKADSVKPEQPGLRMALARALAAKTEFAEAEVLYRGVIAKDPHLVQAHTELYQLFLFQARMLKGAESQKKTHEAEEALKAATAANPKQFGLLTLLAAHYYGLQRRDEMTGVIRKMKDRAAEFPDAYMMAGDFYLRVGDGAAAMKEYKEGIGKDPRRKLEYEKRIIEVLMRQGNKAKAAELNNAILEERPKDSDARALAGSLLLDSGDLTRAVAELQGVVNSAPDNFVARFHLGRAHSGRGEWEQARQQFTQAIRLRPDYVPARLALARLQATRGEYDAAVKTCADILKLDPQNQQAKLVESAALVGLKKFAESRGKLEQMLQANASSPDVLFQIGMVNLAEKKFAEAEQSFRKAYELNPAGTRGLMGIIETYMAQNKQEQAIRLLEEAAAKDPKRLDLQVALGNVAVRAGKFDVAAAQFRRALETLDKQSRAAGDLHLRLGETYRRKGDLNGSIASLQKARELMPENAIVASTLAMTLDSAGRKQEARSAYEQTLKLDPSNAVALNNLAFLIAEYGGDLDQALTYAQRAKQMMPTLLEVSDTLGWIYLKKNMSDSAIDIFTELVRKQPDHALYQYHLGMAFSQKGDRRRAIQALETALKNSPRREDAVKIREMLAKLG